MTRNCQLLLLIPLIASCVQCLSSAVAVAAAGEEDRPDCSAQVVQLAPCLSFVSGQDTKPPQTCCEALSTVLVETPSCLCEIIGSKANATANTGLPSINLTLVKLLPKECGVQEQVKIDESRCPGHGNQTLAPPSSVGTSPPGMNSGSMMLVSVPSICSSLLWAILILTASGFQDFRLQDFLEYSSVGFHHNW